MTRLLLDLQVLSHLAVAEEEAAEEVEVWQQLRSCISPIHPPPQIRLKTTRSLSQVAAWRRPGTANRRICCRRLTGNHLQNTEQDLVKGCN